MAYKAPTTHTPQVGVNVPYTFGSEIVANFNFLNSAFYIPLFPHTFGISPASGLQAAQELTIQSSDAGTIKPEWRVLALDKDVDEGKIWNGTIPPSFVTGVTLVGHFYMPTVIAGTFAPAAQMACWSADDATVSSKAFGAVNTISAVTVPGTALTLKSFTITMSNIDSGVAADSFALVFFRDVSEDNAAEDVYLKKLDLYFTLN